MARLEERENKTGTSCAVDSCDSAPKVRGWCWAHYKRWYKYGDPTAPGLRPVEQMFWDRVQKTDSCWNWTGHVAAHGYGRFNSTRLDLGTYYVHRQVFYFLGMTCPQADEVVDHLCHNTICVNPAHLRITTQQYNAQNQRGARAGSASGLRGVTVRYCVDGTAVYKPWVVVGGKSIYLGSHKSRDRAIAIADDARRELFEVPGGLNGKALP